MVVSVPVQVRYKDLDPMGHVNNAVYVTYLEYARTRWYLEEMLHRGVELKFVVVRLELDYLRPILISDKVQVEMWVTEVGTSSFTMEYQLTNGKEVVYTRAKSIQVRFNPDSGKSEPLSDVLRNELLRHVKHE